MCWTDWSSEEYWGSNLIWASVSTTGLYSPILNKFLSLPAEHKTISQSGVSSASEVIFRFFFYSLSRHLLQLALGFPTVQGPPAGRSHQCDRKMNLDRGIHLMCWKENGKWSDWRGWGHYIELPNINVSTNMLGVPAPELPPVESSTANWGHGPNLIVCKLDTLI